MNLCRESVAIAAPHSLSDHGDMIGVQARPAVKIPAAVLREAFPLRQKEKDGLSIRRRRAPVLRPGGKSGGVRKRKCPYKVLGHSLNGPRQWLPYCRPLALCGACYTAMGGQTGVHRECRAAAAASQAAGDEIERQLDDGESLSIEAFGDWEPTVPKGMVGLKFVCREVCLPADGPGRLSQPTRRAVGGTDRTVDRAPPDQTQRR